MDLDPENPFAEERNFEAIRKLFTAESDYMVAKGYSERPNASVRRQEALKTILQHHSSDDNSDLYIPFLAMNYFDRYFSRQPHPNEPQETLNHFAICCLTLASKFRRTEFSVTAFLKGRNLNMNKEYIACIEALILLKLEQRMRSVTALCFLDFFISLFNINNPRSKTDLKQYAMKEIIIRVQADIKLTQFKPSIIAASVLLAASAMMFPERFSKLREAVSSCGFVKKGDLNKCMDAIMIMLMVDLLEKISIPSDPSAPTDGASAANATINTKPERVDSTEAHEQFTDISKLGHGNSSSVPPPLNKRKEEFEENDDEAQKAKKQKK